MKRFLRQLKSVALAVEAGPFTAVDFDRQQLRVVYADHRGTHTKIRGMEAVDMPADIDLADPKAVGAFIGSVVRPSPMRGAGLVMSVPREQAMLKSLTLPPAASPGELAGMVLFQVEKELPVHPDEAVVDFTRESHYDADAPAGGAQAHGTGVLVAAVRLPVVEHYRQIAAAAKLRLLRLGLRSYANACCVEACAAGDTPGCVALVHLTADEAETDVLLDGSLAYSRSAVVKLPPRDASAPQRERDEAVEAVALEASRSLQSYHAVQRERRIERVLVAGGTGLEEAVRDALRARLEVDCQVLDPAKPLRLKAPDGAGRASGFVAALGLALGHRRASRLPFDFLHPKRPPVQRDVAKIRRVALAAAAVLALAVLLGAGWLNLREKQARVDELLARKAELEQQRKEVADPLAKRVRALEAWTAASPNWLDQWALLTGVFPAPSDAYITALRVGGDQSINFTVKARSADVITDLGERLTAAGYDYRPGQVSQAPDPNGYTYTTDVKVMITPRVKVELASLRPAERPADDVSGDVAAPAQPAPPAPAPPQPAAQAQPAEQPAPQAREGQGAQEGEERPGRRRRRNE